MKKPFKFLTASLFAAVTLAAGTALQAQTVINTLPYTITAGGIYVLNSNLSSTATSGNLITINASNVTIDFQNHYITGPSASLATTSLNGILAYERSNLNIRNGTVAYCNEGIYIYGNGEASTNNVDQQITNMRVTYCSVVGIEVDSAPSSVVSGCQVSHIGAGSNDFAAGITIGGAGVTVQSCTVSSITDSSGIDNYGIYSDDGSFTRQCQVSSAYYGVNLGIYQDNLVSASADAFDGGTDGGGNFTDGTAYTAGIRGTSRKVRMH